MIFWLAELFNNCVVFSFKSPSTGNSFQSPQNKPTQRTDPPAGFCANFRTLRDMLFVFGQFYKVVRQLTALYYHHQQHNKPLEMQWPKDTRQWSDFIDDQPRAAQAMHSGSPTCPSHFTCIVVCRHQVINLRSATL